MKKEFTKEEKKEYYRGLRERWNAAKSFANQNEIQAINLNPKRRIKNGKDKLCRNG